MPVVAKFESSTDARRRLTDIIGQMEALKRQAKTICIDALKETCQLVFTEHPSVEQFAWVQYGGEYNDEGPYHGINEVLINDEVNDTDNYDLMSNHPLSGAIHQKINELGPEILLEALGAYHQVVVDRDSIAVDQWDGY